MKGVILASASPRRLELLKQIDLEAMVIPSNCDESCREGMTAEEIVKELSLRKAKNVEEKIGKGEYKSPDCPIIGADTLVYCDNKTLGKPKDKDDAFRMIKLLQGRSHTVCTGVTIISRKSTKTFAEISKVEVYPISDEEIWDYIASGEPMDKAGAYAIQGLFSKFIKKIDGDYSNIVGLPLGALYQALKEMEG